MREELFSDTDSWALTSGILVTVRFGVAYSGHSRLEMSLTMLRTSLLTDLSEIEKNREFLWKMASSVSQKSSLSIRSKTSHERFDLSEIV